MKKKSLFAGLVVSTLLATGLISANVASAADRTITMWVPNSRAWQLNQFNQAAARIEAKHPGLNIQIVGGQDMEVTLAAINAGNGPDISMANGVGNVGWFCGTGAWKNLNKYINGATGMDMKKTYSAAALNGITSNGKTCALPFSSEIFGFFYNKDLFKDAGIKRAPETLSELKSAAKKLTVIRNGEIIKAGYLPWTGYMDNDMEAVFLGFQFNAQWFTAKNKSAFASDPAWAEAFKWQRNFIADVYGGGNFAKGSQRVQAFIAQAGAWWASDNDFNTGRLAMVAHADWLGSLFCNPDWDPFNCDNPDVNFAAAPLPVKDSIHDTQYGAGMVGSNPMGISRGTDNMRDAFTVLKEFTMDKKLAVNWANTYGDPSHLLAARQVDSGVNTPKWLKPFIRISNHPNSGYHKLLNTGEHEELNAMNELFAAWQANSLSDLKAGLKGIAQDINELLARNNS